MIIRELAVWLGFDIDKSVGDALIVMEQVNRVIDAMIDKVKEVVSEAAKMPEEMAHVSEELEILSNTTGISTDTLQVLGEAARRTGTSLQAFAVGFRAFAMHAEEAREGNVEAAQAFQKLGVHITDAAGHLRPAEELFLDVANAIGAIPNKTERVAAAAKLLGRGALQLLPILSKGKDGLADLRKELEDTGALLTERDIGGFLTLHDVLESLELVFKGLWYTMGRALLPAFLELKQGALEFWQANGPLIRGAITKAFKLLGDAILVVYRSIKLLTQYWKTTIAALATLGLAVFLVKTEFVLFSRAAIVAGIAAVRAALAAAWAWTMAALPVVAIVAALALVLLVLEDIWGGLHGKDALLGDLWEYGTLKAKEFVTYVKEELGPKLWAWVKDQAAAFFQWIGPATGKAMFELGAMVRNSIAGALGNIPLIGGALSNAIGTGPFQGVYAGTLAPTPAIASVYGGAGPGAGVVAPQFQFSATINAPGADANAIASALSTQLAEWQNNIVQETYNAVQPVTP